MAQVINLILLLNAEPESVFILSVKCYLVFVLYYLILIHKNHAQAVAAGRAHGRHGAR